MHLLRLGQWTAQLLACPQSCRPRHGGERQREVLLGPPGLHFPVPARTRTGSRLPPALQTARARCGGSRRSGWRLW